MTTLGIDMCILMHHKSEAFEKFKEFRVEVEKQLDTHIKAIQSNRGSEYLSNGFIDYLVRNWILSVDCTRYAPVEQYSGKKELDSFRHD